jgi:hypothetical protein
MVDDQKATWSDVKNELKSIGKDKYETPETRESKIERVAQKKLSASEDPSVYGKFLENSKELEKFQLIFAVSPLVYISGFLFSDINKIKSFSTFSKYYIVAWALYCIVTTLLFAVSHHRYLSNKTLLSMPLEFWIKNKDQEEVVQRRRRDLKLAYANNWHIKWTDRLVTWGALVSAIGVIISVWEIWKLIS